jgi:hypothetical protein
MTAHIPGLLHIVEKDTDHTPNTQIYHRYIIRYVILRLELFASSLDGESGGWRHKLV